MSTLPMPATPAAPGTAAATRPGSAENTHAGEPAFATALSTMLGSGRARAVAAPADPVAANAADEEDAVASSDVVYHVHTSVAPAPAPAAGAERAESAEDANRTTAAVEAPAGTVERGIARERRAANTHDAARGPDGSNGPHAVHGSRASHDSRSAHGANAMKASTDPSAQATNTTNATNAGTTDATNATNAADAARSARTAAPAAVPVTVARRELSLLEPEFRTRLDRVIARLEEAGHSVQVVETYRSQARQDHLFEQGRTSQGSVVTWTRHSQHTAGRAADLMIDGSFEPSAGYLRLARIAAEEGLRTLGARDPGHVELPGGARAAAAPPAGGVAATANVAWVAQPASIAAPAAIAATAQVAHIAHAGNARPAALAAGPAVGVRPGAPAHGASDVRVTRAEAAPFASAATAVRAAAAPAAEGPMPESAAPLDDAVEAHETADGSDPATSPHGAAPAEPRTGQRDRDRGRTPDVQVKPTERSDATGAFNTAHTAAATVENGAARTHGMARTADADIASRVARVLQLQADAAAQPLTRVMLQLGEAGADAGRVRVDLRGGTVDTSIDLADPVRAAELRGRIHELEAALQQRGLEAARLNVRSAGLTATAAALAAATRPAGIEGAVQPPTLEALLTQHLARPSDRQPDGGRQGTDPEQRRPRGDQHRQEAK